MPESPPSEDFYVGYLPTAPERLGVRTKALVLALILFAGAVAALASGAFARLPFASFEFGTVRSFVGTVVEEPYPALLVERPGAIQGLPSYSRYHLVAFGKHGADEEVAGWAGRVAELEGTLVHRDGQTMIELVDGSVREADGDAASVGDGESLGEHRLVGEIVDSKCFLGVMNPGNLKPHRACAARCISGGIPPVLCVREESGVAVYLLLVDTDGSAVNDRVLDHVAEPVAITGEVRRMGEQLVLHADPAGYERL
jgi:hypothetical protein